MDLLQNWKGQSTFGFRFRYRWKSRKRLWVEACVLFKEFVMDAVMVGWCLHRKIGELDIQYLIHFYVKKFVMCVHY